MCSSHFIVICHLKYYKGWRNGLAVKDTGCSSTGPGWVQDPAPTLVTYSSSPRRSNILFWSSWAYQAYISYTDRHTCRQNIHHIKTNFKTIGSPNFVDLLKVATPDYSVFLKVTFLTITTQLIKEVFPEGLRIWLGS